MGVGSFVNALRGLDRLLTLEAKQGAAIEKLAAELDALKTRVVRLETREELVITEARAAASAAASHVVVASFSDVSRRVGMLEERTARSASSMSSAPRLDRPLSD